MTGETCTCGRPKYTQDDLDRWRRERKDGVATTWEHAICWMTFAPCPMRRLAPASKASADHDGLNE